MRRNVQQEFLAVLERELKIGGFPSDEETKNLFRSMATGKAPKAIDTITSPLLYAVAHAVRQRGKKLRFRNEAELNQVIEQMRGVGFKLREALDQALTELRAVLPRKKPGPNPRLGENEKVAIRALIQSYKNNGMTVQFAIRQAAQQYRATPRAIRRVWESSKL